MSVPTEIVTITDANSSDLLNAERAVLVVTKSTCGNCATYQAEIQVQQARGNLSDVFVGKMVLDKPGSLQFKRANPWIADLAYLPYTVLYRKGERVDEFAASKGSYLVERVEDVLTCDSPVAVV